MRLRQPILLVALGVFLYGCGSSDMGPPAADEVVLKVSGMRWPGSWPARAKKALASLPWVDQESVRPNTRTQEVRFKLSDPKSFNEEELSDAFREVDFPNTSVTHRPEGL